MWFRSTLLKIGDRLQLEEDSRVLKPQGAHIVKLELTR